MEAALGFDGGSRNDYTFFDEDRPNSPRNLPSEHKFIPSGVISTLIYGTAPLLSVGRLFIRKTGKIV